MYAYDTELSLFLSKFVSERMTMPLDENTSSFDC